MKVPGIAGKRRAAAAGILFALASFLPVLLLRAQTGVRGPVRIVAAVAEGNKITASDVILREIPFAFPAVLTDADIELIQNRVQNLHLFNRVELRVDERPEGGTLVVGVTESWYLWPSPVLFLSDGDWHKLSYGAQLTDGNFRGRNEKLRIGGWFGYNPSYSLGYSIPWIGDRLRLSLGVSAFRRRTESRIFAFAEDRVGFSLTVGRRISLELQTELQFSLQRVTLPAGYAGYSASGSGRDLVPTFDWRIRWEHRDLVEYPKSGAYLAADIMRSGWGAGQPDFWRATLDARGYAPLAGSVSIGARQLLILSSGALPVYDRVYLGYGERVRGYHSLILPDPALFADYGRYQISLTSLELRFPIIPIQYVTIKNVPLVPNLFKNLKLGLSAGVFFDGALIWRNAREISWANLYAGYGVGLHLHLPYINVLRLEYALNNRGRGEFIAGTGVSF